MPTAFIRITFDPDGAEELLQHMLSRLDGLDAAMEAIGNLYQGAMAANFASQPWPPLKQSTIERKAREGYPSQGLVRTGAMMESATGGDWQVQREGRDWVAELEVEGYSTFHWDGTRNMPARDYAFVPNSVWVEAERIISTYLLATD